MHAQQGSAEGAEGVNAKEAMAVAGKCRSMGGTLEAVGAVIEALVTGEILKAKCVPFRRPTRRRVLTVSSADNA